MLIDITSTIHSNVKVLEQLDWRVPF